MALIACAAALTAEDRADPRRRPSAHAKPMMKADADYTKVNLRDANIQSDGTGFQERGTGIQAASFDFDKASDCAFSDPLHASAMTTISGLGEKTFYVDSGLEKQTYLC
jgi:hypothetical protein